MIKNLNSKGKVIIAGAGPGDTGLITVKALGYVRKCDVILYDKLANPELLSECQENCEKIFVGKEAGLHHVSQDNTISILIEKAKEGKLVLRLKGGDPLIFGRGSEEAMAMKQAGIEFEIIPGITAGAAVSSYAGIPLTHRSLVAQTIFVTAHESPDKPETQVEWELLAKMKNTVLVIYMGATMLPKIAGTLIGFGMDKDTNIALIENGTLPQQRTFISRLCEVKDDIIKYSIKPPVITLIGPTIAFRDELKWFENKPLFGKRIVATRAADQANSLYEKLRDLGAIVIPFKVIKTKLTSDIQNLRELFSLNNYEWLIFSSENGVRYFFSALESQGLDSRILNNLKIAVIGSGTASKLNTYFLKPDFVPTKFTSEDFVYDFTNQFKLKGEKILRIKGDFENDIIRDGLEKAGVDVDSFVVYDLMNDKPDENVKEDLRNNGADAFTFTSSSTVNNFFTILGEVTAKNLLLSSKVFAIGPVTEKSLKEHGIVNVFVADIHTLDGLIEKVICNI
ncbi:MAG: uroporphyrinogen-III C-methyltransferase [bacterium]